MDRDEDYIVALCDELLGLTAERQCKFAFLLGDIGQRGGRAHLPVDAFYDELNLAIEYRELQHTEAVAVMDYRHTISGVSRAEQRRKYDQRRRAVLPAYDIRLIELDYSMFEHDTKKRLKRNIDADREVLRKVLDL